MEEVYSHYVNNNLWKNSSEEFEHFHKRPGEKKGRMPFSLEILQAILIVRLLQHKIIHILSLARVTTKQIYNKDDIKATTVSKLNENIKCKKRNKMYTYGS